jgi:hypothetical protein
MIKPCAQIWSLNLCSLRFSISAIIAMTTIGITSLLGKHFIAYYYTIIWESIVWIIWFVIMLFYILFSAFANGVPYSLF